MWGTISKSGFRVIVLIGRGCFSALGLQRQPALVHATVRCRFASRERTPMAALLRTIVVVGAVSYVLYVV
jgi:hypothetical protein